MASNQYQFKSQQEHYPQELDKTHLESYRNLNSKLTQVIVNFFTKTAVIIYEARSIPEATPMDVISNLEDKSKINKWFNLNTNSTKESLRDELKLWKSISDLSTIPPMIIETYLDLRQLSSNEAFVLKDDFGKSWSVAKGGGKRKEVVLERWCVEFEFNQGTSAIIDELPLIYKRAIILLRSLYGFSRIISSYKLKRLIDSNNKLKKLQIKNKTIDGTLPISSKGRVGLSKSIIPHQLLTTESHLSQKQFQPVQTSLGTFKISVAYRNHYEFDIVDKEEALSTEFMNMDNKHTTGPRARFDIEHVDEIDSITSKESPHEINHPEEDGGEQVQLEHQDDVDQELDEAQQDSMEYSSDLTKDQASSVPASNKQLSISSVSMSVSPCSSANKELLRENSPGTKKQPKVSLIQPFKVGSISDSPPTIGSGGSSLERKVSITSNKSASNASLAATLRNPRSSTSLSHTATIPINNNPSNTTSTSTATGGGVVTMGSIPRSISSSHGSNLHPDETVFSNDSNANTPRFSSSFGSRATRRFSNTSIKQNTPLASSNSANAHDILGTSIGSTTSSGAPFSGLYLDDDINDFVRMIDSTSDLRFSSAYNSNNSGLGAGTGADLKYNQSSATSESLHRFHSLKSQHQQLGESVHASLVSQSGTGSGIGITGSRASSRKSSHSMNSPPASIPSISSRLKERSPGIGNSGSISGGGHVLSLSSSSPPPVGSQIPITGVPSSGAIVNEIRRSLSPDKRPENNSNSSFLKATSTNQVIPDTIVSRTTAHGNSVVHKHDESVGGLATTPSVYKKNIRYENVFDDDDEDDEDNGSKVGAATTIQTEQHTLKSKPTDGENDCDGDDKNHHDNHDDDQDRANTTIEKQHEADDHHLHHHLHHHHHHHHNATNHEDFEDDDLLFTMSDMNLTKH